MAKVAEVKRQSVPKGYEEVKGGDLTLFSAIGDFAEGRYVGVETGKGKHESCFYNYIDKETKNAQAFFGSVVIDRLMAQVEVDATFKIVFIAIVKSSSGRKVKDFQLFVKK